MDDDFSLGSVWSTGADDPLPPLSRPPPAVTEDDVFDPPDDAFDDFGEPPQIETANGEDDDFGDFGDFGDADDAGGGFADDAGFEEQARMAGPSSSTDWTALNLNPLPSRTTLQEQVDEILEPLWSQYDASDALTADPIRDVGGLNQILVMPESRALYQTLFPPTPPPAHPPNWTRSRIRRQHLIALGIPVNLDEVLPHTNGKPLPALQITTRPMSAPPGARPLPRGNGTSSSLHPSRAGSPAPDGRGGTVARLGLGPKPQLDEQKIDKLLNAGYDQLSLLPLPALERHLAELRGQTSNTSAVLAHLLQTRDALQQDSEMYNKLIGELVGEAQKMKSGKLGKAPTRRGSGMV